MQDRIILDMISFMDLEIPTATLVVPEWDLGVFLDASIKSPYEPLR